MAFIQSFLEHTKYYESPKSFWFWSAIASIAGVLRDNVWLVDGDSRLYPNIYVLFLAESAQRKGRPVTFSEELVYATNNVKIISGRASIQAILVEIGQTETDSKGVLKRGGSAIFYAPELAAGLVTDDQSIQILTDIYDYKSTGHTTNLIGRGKNKLDKVIFSMLAASNNELLKELYSSKAIHGGLLGRTFLITSDQFRPGNAFPVGNPDGVKELVAQLIEISKISGEIHFEPEAKQFYTDWYMQFRDYTRKRDDKSGVFGRIHTNVKKIALIFAANDLCSTVHVRHVEQAIHECLLLIPNYSSFIIATGKSTIAEAGAIILDELSKKGQLSRKDLIRDHWMHFDPDILDKTVAAFETAGIIGTTTAGSNIFYVLTAKGKEIMGTSTKEAGAK